MINEFVNARYVIDNIKAPLYVVNAGVVKRYIPSPLSKKCVKENGLWYNFEDLPEELRYKLKDTAITYEELVSFSKNSKFREGYYSSGEDTRIYINGDSLILPIIENFLPSDGINAYTVVYDDEDIYLKPILICFDCHWSDLFTGNTKYGNNVFCLAADLSYDLKTRFIDDFIRLKDAPSYLENEEMHEKRI